MKLYHKITLPLLAIGLMISTSQALAAAFGVSPPYIVNETIKPGTEFVYVIDLSTNDIEKNKLVTTRLTGDEEVTKWVSVRGGSEITMPAGEIRYPMYVDVRVPDDATPGKYEGAIALRVVPEMTKDSVAIALGGHITIDLNVVNYDVTDYSVHSAHVSPITEGQAMDLALKVKNEGNTTLSNITTKVDVLDYKTKELVESFSESEISLPVKPNSSNVVYLNLPTQNISSGKYWANISVLNDDEQVYSNRLYMPINSLDQNTSVKTSVTIGDGTTMKRSAPEKMYGEKDSQSVVKTSVKVGENSYNSKRTTGKAILSVIALTLVASAAYNATHKKKRR